MSMLNYSPCTVKVAHLNVRSLLSKMDSLRDAFARCQQGQSHTILTLSETWLSGDVSNTQIEIQGYTLHRLDRPSHGGGTAVYIPSHMKAKRRKDLEICGIEILWLELRFRLKRVLLGVVYRPPDSKDFFSEFTNILARATAEANKTIMLAGDFNCDVLSTSSRQTRLLEEIIEEFQLIQVIQDPTRVTNNSSTLIDLILCSEAGLISNAKSLPCRVSDHHLVYCEMSVHSSKPPVRFVTTRHLHKCDPSDIIQDLSRAPWQVLETFDDLDDVVEAWNVLFLEILDQHAPARKVRVRAKSLPWIDDELRVLMRQRDWLHKKAIKSGDDDLWDIYRAARNREC